MCGISGFIDFDRRALDENLGNLTLMKNAMHHRGPDGNGTWHDDSAGIYLSHNRLAIIDISAQGHQPMISHCGRYVIVFNGEIYNFSVLRDNLLKEGFIPKGTSDTEILINYIALHGFDSTLDVIEGMFAFVVWDRHEKNIYFARDHLGKKPLYFGFLDKKLIFASELKAFHVLNLSLRVNPQIVAQYTRYGYIAAPYSIYDGIYKLPAAHCMKFDVASLNYESQRHLAPHKYYKPYWSLKRNNLGSKVGDLETLLVDAVKKRMISDVPLGAFLSGGIDSSLVVALMQANCGSAINTFTIGFNEQQYDESHQAKKISQHLGTNHHCYQISDAELLDIVPSLSTIYDEPFADSSQIPSYAVCRQARQQLTVALTGDGGDEFFCGYSRYHLTKKLYDHTHFLPRSLRTILSNFFKSCPVNVLDSYFPVMSGNRIHSIAEYLPYENFKDLIKKVHSNKMLDRITMSRDIDDLYNAYTDKHIVSNLTDPFDTMMKLDIAMYLPDDILVKMDRASMANSLEIRSPLLDKNVIEWAWAQPANSKLRDKNRGKKQLYNLACKYIPENLLNQPKKGFGVPLDTWLKRELNDWANDLLSIDTLNKTNLYDAKLVSKLWHDFQRGKISCTSTIWTILMAQSWALKNTHHAF